MHRNGLYHGAAGSLSDERSLGSSEDQSALACNGDGTCGSAQVFFLFLDIRTHLSLISAAAAIRLPHRSGWRPKPEPACSERGQRRDQHLQAIVVVPLAEGRLCAGRFRARPCTLIDPASRCLRPARPGSISWRAAKPPPTTHCASRSRAQRRKWRLRLIDSDRKVAIAAIFRDFRTFRWGLNAARK